MLEVKREFIATVAGAKVVLVPEEVQPSTSLVFVCDSPRHDARGLPKDPVCWIEEEAIESIDSLPDPFFSIIKVQPYPTDVQKTYYFCSPGCVKDWMTYSYQAPMPPKRVKEALKLTAEAQARLDPQMKLPFPAPQVEPSEDATGYSEPVNA
jgi:hypothetical protein